MLLTLKRVGRHAHQQIIELGCDSDVSVGNCLVDMHTRCGSMEDATGRGAPCHFCEFAECAIVVALEEGRSTHEQIIQSSCESDNFWGE
jgi:hypothetical protein